MIVLAKFANPEGLVVEAQTFGSRPVLVPFDGPDISGAWRDVYLGWAMENETQGHVVPASRRTAADRLAGFGFDAFALVNHFDTERKLSAQSLDLPPKCAATRAWIDAVQIAYASGQTLPDAPFTLPELLEELTPLSQP